MIMILSCCDLLAVLFNNPLIIVLAILNLTGSFNGDAGNILGERIALASWFGNAFYGFSFFALMVMSFDRYLATHYPILHRTSVTKGKLTSLFVLLTVIRAAWNVIPKTTILSTEMSTLISLTVHVPPVFFLNFKLFVISRKRPNNQVAGDRRKAFALKNVSSCLLVVICFVVLSTPLLAFVGLAMNSDKLPGFNLVDLVGLWAKTVISMNSTFNCLIFYWKNKLLRTMGTNVIKGVKIRREVQT